MAPINVKLLLIASSLWTHSISHVGATGWSPFIYARNYEQTHSREQRSRGEKNAEHDVRLVAIAKKGDRRVAPTIDDWIV